MAEKNAQKIAERESAFNQQLNAKLKRKLKAQSKTNQTIWSGLGMIGLIGWSVVVPTLLGVMLGNWIDQRYPSPHSWTLALLSLGLVLGCVNAWHWVDKENQNIHKQDQDNHE